MPVSRGNPQKTSVSSASSAFSGFGFDPGKCPYSPLISFATLALCFSFFARFLLSRRLTTGGGPRTERDRDFTAFVALNLPGFFFLGMSQFNQNRFHRKGREGRKGRTKRKACLRINIGNSGGWGVEECISFVFPLRPLRGKGFWLRLRLAVFIIIG